MWCHSSDITASERGWMYLTGGMAGMIRAEMTSADLEKSLDEIRNAGIELIAFQNINELSCTYTVCKNEWKTLREICSKMGNSLRIVGKTGLYWHIRNVRNRLVLAAGLCLMLALSLLLPTRVLFVQVEGNQRVPKNRILEAAEASGIHFGTSRRKVRSEQTKNTLLSQVDALQWAGVNTSGCVATVSVRERDVIAEAVPGSGISNIVAVRDGYIVSCTGTQGNVLVQPGQSVYKGQVLISGYADLGLCIQAVQAEGEIMALTERQLDAVCPAEYLARDMEQDAKRKISILLGKKRINLWKGSGISGASCGRMYKEYYITLPGGFRLPFALCIDRYTDCDLTIAKQEQPAAQAQLMAFASGYLSEKMIAGNIMNAVQQVRNTDSGYCLHGRYACLEMIGKERREQNGDIYGKSS